MIELVKCHYGRNFRKLSLNSDSIMPTPLKGGAIKRWCCLTSVAWIGPKSITDRPRKTKISTEVAYVTRDSDTTFKIKRSKVKVTRPLYSPPCWRVRPLQRWAWERVGRGKLLLHCRLLGGARRFGAHGGGEGRGYIVAAARLQLVFNRFQPTNASYQITGDNAMVLLR